MVAWRFLGGSVKNHPKKRLIIAYDHSTRRDHPPVKPLRNRRQLEMIELRKTPTPHKSGAEQVVFAQGIDLECKIAVGLCCFHRNFPRTMAASLDRSGLHPKRCRFTALRPRYLLPADRYRICRAIVSAKIAAVATNFLNVQLLYAISKRAVLVQIDMDPGDRSPIGHSG